MSIATSYFDYVASVRGRAATSSCKLEEVTKGGVSILRIGC
jgi:hypothetical protein